MDGGKIIICRTVRLAESLQREKIDVKFAHIRHFY